MSVRVYVCVCYAFVCIVFMCDCVCVWRCRDMCHVVRLGSFVFSCCLCVACVLLLMGESICVCNTYFCRVICYCVLCVVSVYCVCACCRFIWVVGMCLCSCRWCLYVVCWSLQVLL